MLPVRDAPKVTVTDPSRPGGAADVMVSGDEREPWRASRRQKALLAGALVVALLVAAGVQVVRHQREQTRLDALSVAQVSVAVTIQPALDDSTTGTVHLALRNDTPVTVHVDRLRVDLPGLPEVRIDKDLLSAEFVTADVPDRVTCSPDVKDTQRQVRGALDVRTARGVRATVPVTLLPDAVQSLLGAAQDRCHFLPLTRALSVSINDDARRAGKQVVADLLLSNDGLLPLTVTGIQLPSGFALGTDASLPLSLPIARFDAQGARISDDGFPLRLTIGVEDCGAARQAVTSPDFDPEGDFVLTNGTDVANVPFAVSVDGAPVSALVTALCA